MMKLFGKKKTLEVQETCYEIFGGFTINKKPSGYEITWRSPNLTTITIQSKPEIAGNVQVKNESDKIQVLSTSCKLRLTTKEGSTLADISAF